MDIKSQKNRLSVVELKFARKQAICLRTQYSKMTQIEISHVIGVIPTTIGKCFKKYLTGGEQELKTPKKGSKVSHRKGLSDEDEGKIRCFFVEKMSEQLKFPLALFDIASGSSIGGTRVSNSTHAVDDLPLYEKIEFYCAKADSSCLLAE